MTTPIRQAEPWKRQLFRLFAFGIVVVLCWAWQTYGPDATVDVAPTPTVREPRPTPSPSVGAVFPRTAGATAPPSASAPPRTVSPRPAATSANSRRFVRGVTLRDENGDVLFRGDVDLNPTIERVRAGRKLRFPNDGTTFQNRERRLPQKFPGYYREWVVPTPGDDGPGPQRLVTGEDGDVWYTHDHYRSFRRID